MDIVASRAAGWSRAVVLAALAALGACSDDDPVAPEATPTPKAAGRANAKPAPSACSSAPRDGSGCQSAVAMAAWRIGSSGGGEAAGDSVTEFGRSMD